LQKHSGLRMSNIKTEQLIEELTGKYGTEKTEKLVSYIDMVLDRNKFINLTAVRDRDEAMQKHLADSLAVTSLPEYINAKTVIDVGTGTGFPGSLLAIADPDKSFILLDSTLKRLKVIDEFAETLGITNIRTVHARAEEIQNKPEYKEQFDLCVSRAVASMDKLTGWCLPFVRKGGSLAAYKGIGYENELTAAEKKLKKYRGRLDRIESAGLEDDGVSGHVIIVIDKY